jgi:PAS domain S-box-containing protein
LYARASARPRAAARPVGVPFPSTVARAVAMTSDETLRGSPSAGAWRPTDGAGSTDPLLRLMHSAQIGLSIGNCRGELLDANRAFVDLVGYSVEELRALGWRAITAPECAERDRAALDELTARGATKPFEKRYVRRDGSRVPVMVSAARLDPDADEHVTFVIDARARQDSEERLMRTNALLRAVSEGTSDLIYLYAKDVEGRFLFANPAAQRALGRSAAELIGLTDADLLSDREQAARIRENDERVMRNRRAEVIEETAGAQETTRIYLSTKSPFFDEAGRVAGIVGISTDITERKRMEESLRELDRRKDEFLALLAHELRNPLAPLRTGIELLARLPADDERRSGTLESMRRQVLHLTRLVDDLLDAARINQGAIALRPESVKLSDVVARSVEIVRPVIDARRHRLDVSVPAIPAVLQVDATRIVQVLDNLLSNAAKYTPAGGLLRLSAAVDRDHATIEVSDSGVGMSRDTLAALFEPFSRARDTEDDPGGLGIGLWLSKRLVMLHGGTIEAHSDGTGKGSRIVVRLPLADTLPPTASPPTAERASPAGPADAVPVGVGHSARVLIVDDNPDAAETMAELLGTMGYECRTAADGPSGLERALEMRPEAILLDIGLPGIDGYELATRLRASPTAAGALIVALTGYGRPEDRVRSKRAGFDAHLVKPVDPDALLDLLASRIPAVRGTAGPP